MLDRYEPEQRSVHTIRVTFAYGNYFGHVALEMSGNCKGGSILSEGIDYWETCDTDDINRLKENDCELTLYADDDDNYGFSLRLKDKDGNVCEFNDLEDSELQDMIISVEFADHRAET